MKAASAISRCIQWMCCRRNPSRNGAGASGQPGQLVHALVAPAPTTYDPAISVTATITEAEMASLR